MAESQPLEPAASHENVAKIGVQPQEQKPAIANADSKGIDGEAKQKEGGENTEMSWRQEIERKLEAVVAENLRLSNEVKELRQRLEAQPQIPPKDELSPESQEWQKIKNQYTDWFSNESRQPLLAPFFYGLVRAIESGPSEISGVSKQEIIAQTKSFLEIYGIKKITAGLLYSTSCERAQGAGPGGQKKTLDFPGVAPKLFLDVAKRFQANPDLAPDETYLQLIEVRNGISNLQYKRDFLAAPIIDGIDPVLNLFKNLKTKSERVTASMLGSMTVEYFKNYFNKGT